jgi:hypothetical protein
MHVYFGQSAYPGYSWLGQAVSDLTAIDSPAYLVASRFSSIYGLLSCVCCLMVCLLVRGRLNKPTRVGVYLYTAMNFVSTIGYTLFPLSGKGYRGEFQDFMHLYVVTMAVVLLSILSLLLILIGGFRQGGNRALGILGGLALASMFFGSIGMGAFGKEYFGLLERFSVFSVVVFTGILGVFGFGLAREGRQAGRG